MLVATVPMGEVNVTKRLSPDCWPFIPMYFSIFQEDRNLGLIPLFVGIITFLVNARFKWE